MSTQINNNRIVKNTLFLYVRMLILMGITLYTSRMVLQVLGVTDFGVYNVVGGVVSILGFFTSSLSNASQRYISVGLGKNDQAETESAFRQSFTLMLLLSVAVLVLGETVGLWFVHNKLVIPMERFDAAVWVYHFSLISVFFALNQVSLMAAIIAHERMNMYAYLGLFEGVARLLVVYLLIVVTSVDSLILYGVLTALISVATFFFYLFYCLRHFDECKLDFYWNKTLVREMFRFIGYNLFGCFSYSAGIQGTNILLNIFFGPTVNAARAISVQVSTVVTRFTDSIMTAVKPQIIKSYVSEERSYMFLLIEKSTKYAYFLAAILAIPIMFEMQFILNLWLGQIPEFSMNFTRLVLVESLFGVFVPALWIAANATGNIKNNQVYGRLITLFVLPISYLLLLFLPNPAIPFGVAIVSNLLYWLYCLYDIRKQLKIDVASYIANVVKPAIVYSLLLCTVGFTITILMPEDSFQRFLLLLMVSFLVGGVTICLLLDTDERNFLRNMVKKLVGGKR